jgi:proton-translocating NAD(P)+ transhydrogenase subunit alpha
MAVSIAALDESHEGEPRAALTPPVVVGLVNAGHAVAVESGLGAAAAYDDHGYREAGARVVDRAAALHGADILVTVGRPSEDTLAKLRPGQVVVGLLDVWDQPEALATHVARGVRLIALERLPRQISRAQSMDVLSSQASIAGYRAAIVAAEQYGRYFPMMVTAAGTAKRATVLVLGAGVAGLQAIATARRLGARVTGYDVRPAAREEVTSLGATFLTTSVGDAAGEGGYARVLTDDEAAHQRRELGEAMATFDIVITTAKVPGRTPPLLVLEDTVAAMRRGSVIVDLAASDLGGNVAGVVPGERVVTEGGVVLIGAGAIASEMAAAASDAYAKNIAAVLAAIANDDEVVVDPDDDVIGAMLLAPPTEGADA